MSKTDTFWNSILREFFEDTEANICPFSKQFFFFFFFNKTFCKQTVLPQVMKSQIWDLTLPGQQFKFGLDQQWLKIVTSGWLHNVLSKWVNGLSCTLFVSRQVLRWHIMSQLTWHTLDHSGTKWHFCWLFH